LEPLRNPRDAELEFPSGPTSASEQPVVSEDFDSLRIDISQLQEKVSSMQRRMQISRAVPSRPKSSSVSRSPTPAATTPPPQGKFIQHLPRTIRRGSDQMETTKGTLTTQRRRPAPDLLKALHNTTLRLIPPTLLPFQMAHRSVIWTGRQLRTRGPFRNTW
jgi:hypothetical protein